MEIFKVDNHKFSPSSIPYLFSKAENQHLREQAAAAQRVATVVKEAADVLQAVLPPLHPDIQQAFQGK
jgi:hypothetical protein